MATEISQSIQISTANTNRDGTGAMGTLLTGATNGSLVRQVSIKATGTTTAGIIRFFLEKSGGSKRLVGELPVAAVTPSSSVPTFETAWYPTNFRLQNGDILYASTEKAETFNVTLFGQNS